MTNWPLEVRREPDEFNRQVIYVVTWDTTDRRGNAIRTGSGNAHRTIAQASAECDKHSAQNPRIIKDAIAGTMRL